MHHVLTKVILFTEFNCTNKYYRQKYNSGDSRRLINTFNLTYSGNLVNFSSRIID